MKKGRKNTPSNHRKIAARPPADRVESQTPRTDAMLAENGLRCACSDKPVLLCRQLEQELSVAVEEYLKAADEIGEWKRASGLKVCGDVEKLHPGHLRDHLRERPPNVAGSRSRAALCQQKRRG